MIKVDYNEARYEDKYLFPPEILITFIESDCIWNKDIEGNQRCYMIIPFDEDAIEMCKEWKKMKMKGKIK